MDQWPRTAHGTRLPQVLFSNEEAVSQKQNKEDGNLGIEKIHPEKQQRGSNRKWGNLSLEPPMGSEDSPSFWVGRCWLSDKLLKF